MAKELKKVDVALQTPEGEVKETLIEISDTAVDGEATALTDEEKANAADGTWVSEKLTPYLQAYPAEKEFHITSDGQVFLGKDLMYAKVHQQSLKDGKEVHSFTVEKV